MKLIGKRSAGKLHAAFDEARSGNMVNKTNAQVLDPTRGNARGKFLGVTRFKKFRIYLSVFLTHI